MEKAPTLICRVEFGSKVLQHNLGTIAMALKMLGLDK